MENKNNEEVDSQQPWKPYDNMIAGLPKDIVPSIYGFLDEQSLGRFSQSCTCIYAHQSDYYDTLRKTIIRHFEKIPHSIHIDSTICALLSVEDLLSENQTEKTYWIKPDSVTVTPFARSFSAIVQDNNNVSQPLLIQARYNGTEDDPEHQDCKKIPAYKCIEGTLHTTIQAIHTLADLSKMSDETSEDSDLHYCRDTNASRLLISSFQYPPVLKKDACKTCVIHYIHANGKHSSWLCHDWALMNHTIQIDENNNFCIQEARSNPSYHMIIDKEGNITKNIHIFILSDDTVRALYFLNYVPQFKSDMYARGIKTVHENRDIIKQIDIKNKKIHKVEIPCIYHEIRRPKNDAVWTSAMVAALIKTFDHCRGVCCANETVPSAYSAEDCARSAVVLYKGGNRDWVTKYRDALIKNIWLPIDNKTDINPLGEYRWKSPFYLFTKRYNYQQGAFAQDEEAELCEEIVPLKSLEDISLESDQINKHGTKTVDQLVEELKDRAQSKIPEEVKQANEHKTNFISTWYTHITYRLAYMRAMQPFASLAKPLSWLYAPIRYIRHYITQWT